MKTLKQFLLENRMFNPLKVSDLRKDENRVLNFLQKVKGGLPFATISKGDAIIDPKEMDRVVAYMTADNGFPLNRTFLTVNTNKGVLKVPNDFLKTGEFGGKGQGSGTNAETMAMNYFNAKLNELLGQIDMPYIKLKINGREVKAAAMVKTEGKYEGKEPKSDMTIVDVEGNPVAYISHKAGSSAKHYQQYGGLSYSIYANNREVNSFMKDVLKRVGEEGLVPGQSFYREVKDEQLMRQAIYGAEYGGKPGPNNVDEFHLGNMNLVKDGDGYVINSVHMGTNGDLSSMTDGFTPVLFIRAQQKRGDARAAGVVVRNARVGIFPLAKISRNTVKI